MLDLTLHMLTFYTASGHARANVTGGLDMIKHHLSELNSRVENISPRMTVTPLLQCHLLTHQALTSASTTKCYHVVASSNAGLKHLCLAQNHKILYDVDVS